ncbi:MAG TPA: M20/M25/M40 family metallo-hydrolase, partial [Rhodothermales bacterium]|nr:M20/M25/M40 family metallo-hydrolase [Rhodothermales bacterium]
GAIVLVGMPGAAAAAPPSLNQRLSDEEARRRFTPRPEDLQNQGNPQRPGGPPPQQPQGNLSTAAVGARVDSLLRVSGALVRVNPSGMINGLIRAFSNPSFDPAKAIPTVVLRDEDFGRIVRLMGNSAMVRTAPVLSFEIRNTVYPGVETEHNYLAEIPGTNPNEVVMLGGHLDSWHAATGATDNAAGSAVMMEAARILAKVFRETNTRPRRTIRVALWTGEEQGLLGSRAYVEGTFGTAENPKPAFAGFNGYLNVDSGTGRLRGASVFGPTEAAEMLDRILEPLDSLGVAGARPTFSRNIGGSDHTSFNNAGLPGIGMGQDPIVYGSTTWHTNVDTYERLLPRDLQQAAVTVAVAVYHLATRPETLPRFSTQDMPPNPNAPRPAPGSR